MSTVDPLSALSSLASGATPSAAAASKAAPGLSSLQQNDFLTLMLAQLKQQNPLSPADPSQFMTQLAQMSEVSSMQTMQSDFANNLRSQQVLSGAGLVGHQVLAPASSVNLNAGGTVSGAVDVPAGASSVTLSIADASGQVVRTISIAPQSGLSGFAWDGLTNSGASAAAGQYQISASANVYGATQAASTLTVSKVGSVTIDPATQTLELNTDHGTIALSDVRSIM